MRVDINSVLKLINLIQEEVTCPLCFEVFRKPKSLTCIHTFCQCCLQLILEKQSRDKAQMFHCITCPLCRKKTNLEGGLEDIHCNIYLANISNYLRDFSDSTQQTSTSLPSPQVEWDIPLSPKFTGYSDLFKKQRLDADFPPKSCGFDFSFLKHIDDIDITQTPEFSQIINNNNCIVNNNNNNNNNNMNININNNHHNIHGNNNIHNNDLDEDIRFFGEYEEDDSNIISHRIIDDEDLVLHLPSPFCPENGIEISVSRRKAFEIFQLWISKSWVLQKNKLSLRLPELKDFQVQFALFYSFDFTAEISYNAVIHSDWKHRLDRRSATKGNYQQSYSNYLCSAEPDTKIRLLLKKFDELKLLTDTTGSTLYNYNNNDNSNINIININNIYNNNFDNSFMYNNSYNIDNNVNNNVKSNNDDVFFIPLTPLLSPPKGESPVYSSSFVPMKNLPPWYQIWHEDEIAKEVEKLERKKIKKNLIQFQNSNLKNNDLTKKIEKLSLRVSFSNIKYKLLCSPIYLSHYSLDKHHYLFAISAFSGIIHGEMPLGGFISEPFQFKRLFSPSSY